MHAKVFITGGAGFIGSHVAEKYGSSAAETVVYDNLSSGRRENIARLANVKFVRGDILDYSRLEQAMRGCATLFHLAAYVSVPGSMEKPELAIDANVTGTVNVLKAAVANGVRVVVFASSAAVYGPAEACPKRIDMPPEPASPYAITKLAGEHLVNMYARENGFRAVVARFFNVFGERQDPGSLYAAAVPAFITRVLKNEPLTIYGDGGQTRDFIYVKDLACYLEALSRSGTGLYNVGYGTPVTINALAEKIIAVAGSSSRIQYSTARPGDVWHSYADVKRIKKEVRIPLVGFDEGIKRTIAYYSIR